MCDLIVAEVRVDRQLDLPVEVRGLGDRALAVAVAERTELRQEVDREVPQDDLDALHLLQPADEIVLVGADDRRIEEQRVEVVDVRRFRLLALQLECPPRR